MIDGLLVTTAELARRTERSPRTVRRWLKRKGVPYHGQGIILLELQRRWPTMYAAFTASMQVPIPCPGCGSPTDAVCPVCTDPS